MVAEALQLKRCPAEAGGGQRRGVLLDRCPGDRDRVDLIGLAAAALGAAAPAHQLRRDADDALATVDQEALEAPETWRQSSSAQIRSQSSERPQSSSSRKPGFRAAAVSPPEARRSRSLRRRRCGSACGCPCRSRSSASVLSFDLLPTDGPLADRPHWGRCHAPIKSGRRSSGGGERHNAWKSDLWVDTEPRSQLVASPRTNRHGRTSPPALVADDGSEPSLVAISGALGGSRAVIAPNRMVAIGWLTSPSVQPPGATILSRPG